jgi:putative hemolysin
VTLPLGLLVLAAFLGSLLLLLAPHAPRLLRHGAAPPRPRRFWLTLVLTREVGTAGAAAAAAWLALAGAGPVPAWLAALGAGAAAFVVAETLAPALGLLLPDRFADRLSDVVVRLLALLRRPLEAPAVALAARLAGEAGLAPGSALRFAADGSAEESAEAALDDRGRLLLGRVRAFRERPVRDVMTPRLRIISVDVDTPGPQVLALLRDEGVSRLPVWRRDRDDVVGVLYAKDVLGRDVTAPDFRLEPLVRPALFVPLGTRASQVFRELRRRKVHLALVVDEFGGIAGLVTMEDLLEELFGEIRDEYDEGEPA